MNFQHSNKHTETLWFLSRRWDIIVCVAGLSEQMLKPSFAFTTDKNKWGMWSPKTRTIIINEGLAFEMPWVEVEKILRHEIAHQWVTDCGGPEAQLQVPHGPAWQQAARIFNCAPSASSKKDRSPELDKISDKIHKLLALATSANEHESQLAAGRASALMMKHNIEERKTDREFSYTWIGEHTKRRPGWLASIGSILMTHFNVETIWKLESTPTKRGYVLELMGTPANLEIAEYVYNFLRAETNRLWKMDKHKFDGRAKSGYVNGVLAGFSYKMKAEKVVAIQELSSTDVSLALVPDHELKEFFRIRYPRTLSRNRNVTKNWRAFCAGSAQGKNITMRKGMASKADNGKYLTA